MRRCRECGCHDDHACVRPLGIHAINGSIVHDAITGSDGMLYRPCSWADDDLCSACAPGAGSDWQHPTNQEVPSP